jgi:hypothetical protein
VYRDDGGPGLPASRQVQVAAQGLAVVDGVLHVVPLLNLE